MDEEAMLRSFRIHMQRCADLVLRPLMFDAKVTIVVRAPEALPSEAIIISSDSLEVVGEAVKHFATVGSGDRR